MTSPELSPESSSSSFLSARETFDQELVNSSQLQIPQREDAGLALFGEYVRRVKSCLKTLEQLYEVWLHNKLLHADLHGLYKYLPVLSASP